MRLPRRGLPTFRLVVPFLGAIAHAHDLGRVWDWRRHFRNFRLSGVDRILDYW